MPHTTEDGISKEEFEEFFSNLELHSYKGYKWEWKMGAVIIYELVGFHHERAARTLDREMGALSLDGGWDRALLEMGSTRLLNPDPHSSNWEADCSYVPNGRNGPFGDLQGLTQYPTLVVEIAVSEPKQHALDKAWALLAPDTTIQIVVVIVIRSDRPGPDSLELFKLQRDRLDQHFELGNPNCTVPGDPSFELRLPVRLLFDDAPIPPALAGCENIVMDLFSWKSRFLNL